MYADGYVFRYLNCVCMYFMHVLVFTLIRGYLVIEYPMLFQ